jgi:hypothetical protein
LDKKLLRHTLTSGSAKVFNCLELTRNAAEASADAEPMFNVRALNYGVFFKEATDANTRDDKEEDSAAIDTILYFPYDRERIFEGGASVSLNDRRFELVIKEFAQNFGVGAGNSNRDDKTILKVLAETPSFDPFLLKSNFERYQIPVPQAYLRITMEEWMEIKEHVRTKILPMVEFGLTGSQSDAANLKKTEELIEKIWDGSDISALYPLLSAFQIPIGEADDVIFSWKGVTFFEFQYLKKVKDIQSMAVWLKDYSKPVDFIPAVQMEVLNRDLNSVKNKLRSSWLAVTKILDRYNTSYSKLFVKKESTAEFQDFLRGIRKTYVILGKHLNRIDHAVEIFRKTVKGDVRRPLKAGDLQDFLGLIVAVL